MPGIIPFSNVTTARTGSKSPYTHWICGEKVVDVADIHQFAEVYGYKDNAATGICQSGTKYAWGFSFLFTLCVAILHLAFTLEMYALELSAIRTAPPLDRQGAKGEFKDAVTLVTQAQGQFGDQVAGWSAEGLRKRLYGGREGMSFASRSRAQDPGEKDEHGTEVTLGDTYGGDWGGRVVLEDQHRLPK